MAASILSADQIGANFATLTKSDAGQRWRWARQILIARGAEKTDALRSDLDKAIGQACAAAVGRSKPYAASWVRAYVNAAKKFPTEPRSAADAVRFIDLCNGAQSKAKAKKAGGTKDEAMRMLKSAVKLALKRGAGEDEISEFVLTILAGDTDDSCEDDSGENC